MENVWDRPCDKEDRGIRNSSRRFYQRRSGKKTGLLSDTWFSEVFPKTLGRRWLLMKLECHGL
ncbi:hypothetical protein K443DRAFT_197157 [Laccaria amethystina LaAM-08-1]|uniref:Uncharacterized protein n=1 Tax=Laccaria amethystina LaAM-08-1 TaxID=1095629 RepID=A0A0C9WN02_9AGAR|nr:hypothetical protein K443DRAFT_197157 [Laccaria amethystina LaAM-08-1]